MADKHLESFLTHKNPIYTSWEAEWRMNERRLKGGQEVVNNDLVPFEWEDPDGDAFKSRKGQAVYLNFPARVALNMMGALDRKSPSPGNGLSFGTMGDPKKEGTIAYHIWNNADGASSDGSAWDPWWNQAHQMAMATGHRWILAESPSGPDDGSTTTTMTEAIRNRPYLVSFSPLSVPAWHFDGQGLAWCIITLNRYEVERTNGFTYKKATWRYLHVRKGYTELDGLGGITFKTGGWWLFNSKHEVFSSGNYDRTGGQIPMAILFYEPSDTTEDRERISRPGLGEIANLAVSYMNLSSAGDFDAHAGGGRTVWVSGVDKTQHKVTVEQVAMGGRVIGIPKLSPEHPNPDVYELANHSANGAIQGRLNARKAEVDILAADETEMAPSASGASKEASFNDKKSPRLRSLAIQRESCQRSMIRFLEMRAGAANPTGTVTWPKDFSLATLSSGVDRMANLVTLMGLKSPTLAGALISVSLNELGLADAIGPEKTQTIQAEVEDGVKEDARSASLLTAALGGPGGPGDAQDPNQDADQDGQ